MMTTSRAKRILDRLFITGMVAGFCFCAAVILGTVLDHVADPARAQLANVVANCPPSRSTPYPVGTTVLLTVDQNGQLCNSGSGGGGIETSTSSGAITNPTSTLALPSATTAYTAGQNIASSATAGSVVVPSFAIANAAGGALVERLRLTTNDATATAWGSQTIQVDLWSAAPTFTNGDRGTWSPLTGTANHLGAFTCVMSAEFGDGAYSECAPAVGNAAMPKLTSGTSIFWTLDAITGSGVTGASKVFTLTAELLN